MAVMFRQTPDDERYIARLTGVVCGAIGLLGSLTFIGLTMLVLGEGPAGSGSAIFVLGFVPLSLLRIPLMFWESHLLPETWYPAALDLKPFLSLLAIALGEYSFLGGLLVLRAFRRELDVSLGFMGGVGLFLCGALCVIIFRAYRSKREELAGVRRKHFWKISRQQLELAVKGALDELGLPYRWSERTGRDGVCAVVKVHLSIEVELSGGPVLSHAAIHATGPEILPTVRLLEEAVDQKIYWQRMAAPG